MKLNLLEQFKNLVYSLENSKLHITYFIMFFLAVIALRGFWESYSDTPVGNLQDYTGPMMPHFFFWYITLALLIIFVLHIATRENIIKMAKVVFPAFSVLLIVPFVDIVLTWGQGANITYMLPNIHQDIIIRWLTLAGSTPMGMGGTIGLKMEGIIVPLFCFFYLYIKRKGIIYSAIFTFIVYSTAFWWGSLPYLLYYLQILFNVEHVYSEALLTNFELFIIIIFGSILFLLNQKKNLKDFIKKIEIHKIILYELFLIIGVAIAWNQTQAEISISQVSIFYWMFIVVLIPIAYIFQLIINHLMSKTEQLEKNVLPSILPDTFYKTAAVFLFIFVVVYSFTISFTVTFLIMIFIFSYFLYYNSILKIYQFPVLDKVLIAQNIIVITFIGYFMVRGRFNEFPYQILMYFFFALPIIISVVDIKQYDYLKKHDILSIPTLFGLKKSKILIGVCFPIILALPGLIFNQLLLVTLMVGFGIIDLLIITRKKYNETYLFITLFFMMIAIIIFLFNNPGVIPY